jgi:hypothetical protein
MYLCTIEEEKQASQSENSFGRVLTTNQFTSFRVIPHKLWWWERSSANLDLHGLVTLPESFWKREMADG